MSLWKTFQLLHGIMKRNILNSLKNAKTAKIQKPYIDKEWYVGLPTIFFMLFGVIKVNIVWFQVHYFSDAKLDSAINCLKEAGNLGHLGAHYAMAIIFILCEDERRQKGISLLSEMKKSKILGKKVKECRENLKGILKMIWKNSLIVKEKPTCCTMEHLRKKNKKKMDGWSILEGEDQQVICEACCSDFEIASIIDVL